MKIVSETKPTYPMSIHKIVGGKEAEEIWTLVVLNLEDGKQASAWASNVRTGYFKQVFVPLDFEHPEIIP